MKYEKIGKRELHKCIKSQIVKERNLIKCPNCGNARGIDMENFIKLSKGHFTYLGTKTPLTNMGKIRVNPILLI